MNGTLGPIRRTKYDAITVPYIHWSCTFTFRSPHRSRAVEIRILYVVELFVFLPDAFALVDLSVFSNSRHGTATASKTVKDPIAVFISGTRFKRERRLRISRPRIHSRFVSTFRVGTLLLATVSNIQKVSASSGRLRSGRSPETFASTRIRPVFSTGR